MQAINSNGNGVDAKYDPAPASSGVSGSASLGKKPIFGLKSGGGKKAFAKPAFAGFGKKPITIAKRDVKPSNDADFIDKELAAIGDQQKQLIEPIREPVIQNLDQFNGKVPHDINSNNDFISPSREAPAAYGSPNDNGFQQELS